MNTNNESANASTSTQTLKEVQKPNTKRTIGITVIAGLVLLAALWVWKSIEIKNIRKQAAIEKQDLQEQATDQIRQTHEMHLKSLAKPFVWAVRTEMLKNNISQVNLYANDMVKEKNFQKIVITNDRGTVILSTNKKEEGKEFGSIGNAAYLSSNNTTVDTINDSAMVVSSPIMGFNNRLGTLLITYAVQQPIFK